MAAVAVAAAGWAGWAAAAAAVVGSEEEAPAAVEDLEAAQAAVEGEELPAKASWMCTLSSKQTLSILCNMRIRLRYTIVQRQQQLRTASKRRWNHLPQQHWYSQGKHTANRWWRWCTQRRTARRWNIY